VTRATLGSPSPYATRHTLALLQNTLVKSGGTAGPFRELPPRSQAIPEMTLSNKLSDLHPNVFEMLGLMFGRKAGI
jgi:hypothetical protein